MKTYKLKSKHYSDLTQMLIDVGATDLALKQAFPGDVYCSKEDMKKMTQAITKAFKKEYPGLQNSALKAAVGMYLLNYSPNTSVSEAVRSGYVLVDNDSIAFQIEATKKIKRA
jgi:hypothetical protein